MKKNYTLNEAHYAEIKLKIHLGEPMSYYIQTIK